MASIIIRSYAKERQADILRKLKDSMGKAVLLVANQAKQNLSKTGSEHPQTKTGFLRSSVTFKVEEDMGGNITGTVGTNEKYGKYLEFGHRQTPGRYVPAIGKRLKADWVPPYPWLFPAVEGKKSEIKEALKGSRFEVI